MRGHTLGSTYSLHLRGDRWGLHSFAILDFDGPAMHIKFVDQNGQTNYEEQAFS